MEVYKIIHLHYTVIKQHIQTFLSSIKCQIFSTRYLYQCQYCRRRAHFNCIANATFIYSPHPHLQNISSDLHELRKWSWAARGSNSSICSILATPLPAILYVASLFYTLPGCFMKMSCCASVPSTIYIAPSPLLRVWNSLAPLMQ